MTDFEVKAGEFCTKLVNGEIQVSEIPDENFIDVTKRVLCSLPISAMNEVVNRLNGMVATKKQELATKEHELSEKKRKLAELEQQPQQFGDTLFLEELEDDALCTEDEMKQEASFRLEYMVGKLGLNPNVVNYWDNGRLYYSYLTAGGFMGSVDKIEYDSKNVKVVKAFEEEYGGMVYHAIEGNGTLVLLSVSNDSNEWDYERPKGDRIPAYVHCFDAPDQSEFGDVIMSSLHGALVRIG